jgi:H+/Cl- antiporter ClcA
VRDPTAGTRWPRAVRPVDVGCHPTSHVPVVALTALAGLTLGAVVGPEAPLIAIGDGLALIVTRSPRIPETAAPVIAAIGLAAAIAAISATPWSQPCCSWRWLDWPGAKRS